MQKLVFAGSQLLIIFSLLILYQNNGIAQVLIDKRPFSIIPDTMMQNTDGWFDVTENNWKIGVFVKNTGQDILTQVQGIISFEGASGISVLSDTYDFGDLAPNIPVLGIFEASFGSTTPGKYNLVLNLAGSNNYTETVSRKLFVYRTEDLGEKTCRMIVPEGTVTTEILSFYEGGDVVSLLAPTQLKLTMVPSTPFSGQFSALPFNDPWWKVAAADFAIGFALWMAVDAIAEACGGDFYDPTEEKINTALLALSLAVAAKDEKDPFRKGEENTLPLSQEQTVCEEVVMNINYDNPPVAQELFTGTVSWTFTRYTTGLNYTYNVTEPFINEIHSTTNRQVSLYHNGNDLIITIQVKDPHGTVIKGSDAYAIAMLSHKDSPTVKSFISATVMNDAGKGNDETPMDGVYTCSIPEISGNEYIIDVMVQDVNKAEANDPPLIAATKIGGFLISHPMPNPSSLRDMSKTGGCEPSGQPVPHRVPSYSTFSAFLFLLLLIVIGIFMLKKSQFKRKI